MNPLKMIFKGSLRFLKLEPIFNSQRVFKLIFKVLCGIFQMKIKYWTYDHFVLIGFSIIFNFLFFFFSLFHQSRKCFDNKYGKQILVSLIVQILCCPFILILFTIQIFNEHLERGWKQQEKKKNENNIPICFLCFVSCAFVSWFVCLYVWGSCLACFKHSSDEVTHLKEHIISSKISNPW